MYRQATKEFIKAREKGYTHIEGYYVTDIEDKKRLEINYI